MNIKRIIGIVLAVLTFAGATWWLIIEAGLEIVLKAYGMAAGFVLIVSLIVFLIVDE